MHKTFSDDFSPNPKPNHIVLQPHMVTIHRTKQNAVDLLANKDDCSAASQYNVWDAFRDQGDTRFMTAVVGN